MAELFKDIELKRKGSSEVVKAEEALKDKVVAIYFSAHWCPPCRGFTPSLKEFYNEVSATEQFEIVFISFDRTEADLNNYLEEYHGDWLYVPYGSEHIQAIAAYGNDCTRQFKKNSQSLNFFPSKKDLKTEVENKRTIEKRKLGNKFNVSGIPALIVIKPDGTVITSDGRTDVQSKPPKAAFSAWKAGL